jgi:hypothetical protein
MAIKVSQATIDKIKKMGMTAALKSAPKANAEMKEGLRRMYGQRRVSAATTKMAPKPTDSRFSGVKKAAPKPTDSRFSGTKPATAASPMANTPARKAVSGGTAAQKAQAAARAGGNVNLDRTTSATSPKKTPRKPYVAPKATASQVSEARARAGGNVNLNPKSKTPETPAQKAAKAALVKKRREASAAAVKRGGGRTA